MNIEIRNILSESSIFTLREFGSLIGMPNSSTMKKELLVDAILNTLEGTEGKDSSKKGRKHMTGLRGLIDKLASLPEFAPFSEEFEEYIEFETEAKTLVSNYQQNKTLTIEKESASAEIIKEANDFAVSTREISPATPLDFVPELSIFSDSAKVVAKVQDIENLDTQKQEKQQQQECEGYLEIISGKGFGFIRTDKFDVYVSEALIKKMCLKTGDYVKALYSERGTGKNAAFYIVGINQKSVNDAFKRVPFESLQATFPDKKLNLVSDDYAVRAIDLFSPIGKGQRALIVSPPKSGKTTIIKNLAKAIKKGHPEMKIFILLIDERPEEVTDMKLADVGEVVFSAFDDKPDRHVKIANSMLEKAKRLVEDGGDVCILMDSLTRFARAVNMSIATSSRSLSGGMDASALQTVKTFFGSGRNTTDAGSLTLIATALVDTNSRMDDLIFEEFKGTGNMEVVLDRSLSEKRIFPSIDIAKSGTRREELLFSPADLQTISTLRKYLLSRNKPPMENMIDLFDKVGGNTELLEKLPLWFKSLERK